MVNLGADAGDDIRSIELWFRSYEEILPNNSKRITLLTRNSDDQIGEFGIFIGYGCLGEQGRVTFTRQVGSTFYYVYSDRNYWTANKWYHVAAVIDPVTGMKLYIDGVLQQDTDPSFQATGYENEITAIGCWGNKPVRWFAGDIDELRFWNRAISSVEINNFMCDSINPQSAEGLVGYWRMDEGSGDTLFDASIMGFDGYINGAVHNLESIDFSFEVDQYMVQFYTLGDADSYHWDFGDGNTSSEKNPTHVYDSIGVYNACLTTNGICEQMVSCQEIVICIEPSAVFVAYLNDFEISFDQLSQYALDYYWDFGDGYISTEYNPTHTYDSIGTYTVCLTVTNDCGQDTYCQNVNICVDPIADFTYNINNLQVSFYQLSQYADEYLWDFGDGNYSYDPEPVHIYENPENYIVCLTVFNDCGTDQHYDTIMGEPPMMCNFSFIFDNGMIYFTDESLNSTSCYWDFGDGTNSTEQNPVHQYEVYGLYNCCLTIENDDGIFTFCDSVFYCEEARAEFSFEMQEGLLTTSDLSSKTDTWLWDFGDGTTSIQPEPLHKYESSGEYTVCLTSSNPCSEDIFCKDILAELPEKAFDLRFYPNPANDVLRVDIPEDGQYRISIFDYHGKSVYTNELFIPGRSIYELDVSTLPSGVYIFDLRSDNLSERKKIIICRL